MSLLTVKELLETRLNANAGGVAVAFENVRFTPINGAPYQFATLLPADTEDPTMGDGYKRLRGVFQVMLFYPLAAGTQPALTRAQALVAAFPRGLSMQGGAVTVKLLRSPTIGQGRASAAFYELPVTIPYVAEVFG